MSTENQPYHYHYQGLDKFLTQDYDPQAVAFQLDETMSDLVEHTGHEQTYSTVLPGRHFLLRCLRDIFLKMEKVKA